ncbi:MAG: hypothetical protein COW12_06915 [Candidatus Omnitrophica bacterium CG12_big_fil_rev_8_21_14_0_65_45_16]|nr:MAG: hypothetical protein COW12_06915 [Candidatus Omnitrophica bacterium CG12_big_fil_rev_8_21_14_0_65_45_16]
MKKRQNKQKTLKRLGNEGGFALIWTLLICLLLFGLMTGFYSVTINDSKLSAVDTANTQAFYLAESAIDQKLAELRLGNTDPLLETALGTMGTFEAVYDADNHTITASGTSGDATRTATVILETGALSTPPGAEAALTAKGRLSIQDSYMTVDGNDHDLNGDDTSGTEMPGVAYYYTSSTTIGGGTNVKIGGNNSVPIASPYNPVSIELLPNANDQISVNAILGLPEDSHALDIYQSTSPPGAPLNNEIYYYTPTATGSAASVVSTINLGTAANPGSGILIVSRSNSWVQFTGYFRGLIMAHNAVFAANTQIVGGVVLMNSTSTVYGPSSIAAADPEAAAPSETEPVIKYSSEALSMLPTITGGYNDPNYVKLKHWADTTNNAAPRV